MPQHKEKNKELEPIDMQTSLVCPTLNILKDRIKLFWTFHKCLQKKNRQSKDINIKRSFFSLIENRFKGTLKEEF